MNPTLYQSFHWYLPGDGKFWTYCGHQAQAWARLGFTHVWLPPSYKSAYGGNEPGYAVYDLFDLGEFDQKGSVRTKYGTRRQYLLCIKKLQAAGIQVLADVVFNHRQGADETEKIPVRQVHFDNRNEFAGEREEIEAYTKYTFPARKNKYSSFIWDWHAFTGIDMEVDSEKRIYKILNGYGHEWEDILDTEFGNFDYLMGADVEFRNEHVREELKWWGKWFYKTTGVNGFRLDAVKHITPYFFMEWIDYMREHVNKDFFFVSEYWRRDPDYLIKYYEALHGRSHLFDVPLHYNFHEASQRGNHYDLRKIFDDTFLQYNSMGAVTFVDNHDTQPLQSLESTVDYWFKPLAYALILLREKGFPCVFHACLNGAQYNGEYGQDDIFIDMHPVPALDKMLIARRYLSYGMQRDYFDHANTVGWTREGVDQFPHSGIAVVIGNGDEGEKVMELGIRHANKVFVDVTGNRQDKVQLDQDGRGQFWVNGRTASVYVNEEALHLFHA
jgi:alpha-amylase